MEKELNDIKINEIALNPRFCSNEYYKSLENQGISVRWMTEDEINNSAPTIVTLVENE